MKFRDQETYTVDNFRGLYNRKVTRENTPPGYLSQCDDVIFADKSVGTRPGAQIVNTLTGEFIRQRGYRLSTAPTAQNYITLDTAGNFYAEPGFGSPILTIPGCIDFSILCLFDRVYISPHNRIGGMAGEFLYVWEPQLFPAVTTARLAGGTPPTSPVTAVTSATAGNIQAGIHLFAVVCETASGFITRYDTSFPGGFPTYTAPGNFSVDLTVPFGDPGTVSRHILATKRIPSFDGNAENYEFFFIAEIVDNVTPTITIDFIDSQLVDSADYLLDQLENIPAFIQLSTYQGCMVGVGENDNRSIARVSKPGEPESFQETDGFVIVNPGEAGGLKNLTEYRGVLYLYKSFKTYSTINNGDAPNAWPVSEVDSSLGTECDGIAKIFDDPSSVTSDNIVIATRGGAFAFDGSYASRPLSWVIEDTWSGQDFNVFAETQVAIDSVNKLVYFFLPGIDNQGYPPRSDVYICDYSDGLTWDTVRWTHWQCFIFGEPGTQEIRSIGVFFGSRLLPKFYVLLYRSATGNTEVVNFDALQNFGTDLICIVAIHPVNPNGQPTIKNYSGGYFVGEVQAFGHIQVNTQMFNLDFDDAFNTHFYQANTKYDYIRESFNLIGETGAVYLNKVVYTYRDDLDEKPR